MFIPGSKTYSINKGEHYANGWKLFPFITKKNFSVSVLFDFSCIYDGSVQLSEQWNKLHGIGSINHRKNSDRIAWRYNKTLNIVELGLYRYKNGKRLKTQHIGFVHINNWRTIKIKTRRYWFGKYLNPYFGGIEPSPRNIKIKLKTQ